MNYKYNVEISGVENYKFNKTDNKESNDIPCDVIQFENDNPCNDIVTWNNGGYEFNNNWEPYKQDNRIILSPPFKKRSQFN